MARSRISSWRARDACIAGASCSHSLIEPSMSVKRKVTVPVGRSAMSSWRPPCPEPDYSIGPKDTLLRRHAPGSLVHRQDRLCGMSYGSRHETSNLRTCVVPTGAQGFRSRAALQRRLCSASKPDSSGKFAWRVPAQDRSEFGMRLPDGQENAIHDFDERGLGALKAGSSRPKRTRAAFDEQSAETLREMLHRSPREFGYGTSLWTLEMAAEAAFEEGLTERRVSGETIRATLARLLGVRWMRAKRWITSPDPLYERKKGGATG